MVEQDSAQKKASPQLSKSWQNLQATLSKVPRVGLISIAGPVVLLVVGYLLWINYGASHLDRSRYGLKSENISITPPPPWIQESIVDQVFKEADLGRLSTLDKQMTEVVSHAFRIHPWVRQVFRVHKFAGGQVGILVEYREPMAMVYEGGESKLTTPIAHNEPAPSVGRIASNETGEVEDDALFLPVDVDGVLLPTNDFTRDSIRNYFLVYAHGAVRSGKKFGTDYGDVRIRDALQLCRLLRDDRARLELEKIYVYPDPSRNPAIRSTLEITTKSGKRIHWGRPPGFEIPGEPGAPAKHRKLIEVLSNPDSPHATATDIDLVEVAKAKISNLFGPFAPTNNR